MVVSGGLYATYHLLGEPETTIENLLQIDGVLPPWMRKTAEKNPSFERSESVDLDVFRNDDHWNLLITKSDDTFFARYVSVRQTKKHLKKN